MVIEKPKKFKDTNYLLLHIELFEGDLIVRVN
jgi:hypothetical protein